MNRQVSPPWPISPARQWWEPVGPRATPTGTIREVDPTELIDLRRMVLREGRTDLSADHPADRQRGTLHLGLGSPEAVIVGCITVLVDPLPGFASLHLVLMAVDPGHQRTGIGQALINEVQARAGLAGLAVWASSRSTAIDFYRRLEFRPRGDEYVGPMGLVHRRVLWRLRPDASARSGPSRPAVSAARSTG